MNEEMIEKMKDHQNSDLDDRTKIALDLTEDFIMNHANGVDDDYMGRLKVHYSDAEV
ncbi:MAG: hypothetical protein HN900_18215, partial [Gammaproteobacteria bacterium]|nr:hypothetical protein [Gammaproteobacteria bacterium]